MGRRVISGIIKGGLVFLLALLLSGCEQVIMRDLIRGRVMGGEIEVKYGAIIIPDGGSYDYGNIGTPIPANFIIENTGDYTLLLTGSPLVDITGVDAAAYTVTQDPSPAIDPGTTSEFIITFVDITGTPTTATVQITNNDLDEGSFSFTVTGTSM